jgi:hypothetical protein
MYDADLLLAESREALDKVWFLQSLEVSDRTDLTLSFRLYIRHDLFVQVFLGELTDSLYFALIEGNQRIFGIDRECKQWHLHPFEAPHKHEYFAEGLGPKPLLAFLSRVEILLIEKDLL